MVQNTYVSGLNRWGRMHSTRDECKSYFKEKINSEDSTTCFGSEGGWPYYLERFGLRLGAGFSYLGANVLDFLAHVISVVAIAILFIPAEIAGMIKKDENAQIFYNHCNFSQGLKHTVEAGCILLTALPTSVMLAFYQCSCSFSDNAPINTNPASLWD